MEAWSPSGVERWEYALIDVILSGVHVWTTPDLLKGRVICEQNGRAQRCNNGAYIMSIGILIYSDVVDLHRVWEHKLVGNLQRTEPLSRGSPPHSNMRTFPNDVLIPKFMMMYIGSAGISR